MLEGLASRPFPALPIPAPAATGMVVTATSFCPAAKPAAVQLSPSPDPAEYTGQQPRISAGLHRNCLLPSPHRTQFLPHSPAPLPCFPAPGGNTCAEHKDAGDCNTSVTTSRNFCAATCGRCQPAPGAPATAPAAAPAAGNQTEPQAAVRTPEPAAAADSSAAGSSPEQVAAPAPEGPPPVAASASEGVPPSPEQPAAAGPAAEAAAAEADTAASISTAPGAPAPEMEAAAANSTEAGAAASDMAEGLALEESPAPAAELAPTAGTAGQVNGSALGAVAVPGSGKVYTGDGTAYSEAVNNTGKGFACSYR